MRGTIPRLIRGKTVAGTYESITENTARCLFLCQGLECMTENLYNDCYKTKEVK